MKLMRGVWAIVVVGGVAAACSTESESGSSGGTGGAGNASSGGSGGADASTGGSAGSATGGSAGSATGGSAGSATGGSAGSATGGSAGSATGGSAGTASGGSAGTASGGSAGTASGGSAGSATGGSAGTASGGSSGAPSDAGTDGNIQFPLSCASFTPCGGSLVGTWNYAGVCIPRDDAFRRILDACPAATIDQSGGTVTGSLTATTSNVLINATITLAATVGVPVQCSLGQCAQLQTALAPHFDSATCAATSGGGCSCSVALSYPHVAADGYTAAGDTVTTSGGRTFDYCQQGNELVYRETTLVDGSPASAAIFELTRN